MTTQLQLINIIIIVIIIIIIIKYDVSLCETSELQWKDCAILFMLWVYFRIHAVKIKY